MTPAQAHPLPSAPAGRIRVLVADDSVVVRGLIARWLTESGAEVVATVPNGLLAIAALDRVEPDIVLLDLDMPELDGLSTLPRLIEKRPGLSVVVISTLTQRNADISLKCLSLGAVDYLPKPGSNREVTTSLGFRQELVAKVHGLVRPRRGAPPAPGPARPMPRRAPVAPRCLLIGASTGGPRAVAEVLAGLGQALRSVPTLVVQHMPPIFTTVFAEHLQSQTGLPAREARDGEAPVPGHVYVAPGGRHMGLLRDKAQQVAIRLDDGPAVNFCRPAVDVLFRDAAAVFGASALAVVLTGMGSDGLNGARALAETGAAIIAQDEATSTVWGMPGHVARAGLAEAVLPLDGIAPAVRGLLGGPR
ncbi:MAG TPA: chemotaxis response regulator protein-glutamate methylesterase [Beijerinckiaceae bacterium]|jgi:two-component system chemotaxis response regulator CheB